jgi:peptidoglycan hydrolase-like protein with peptidoglycan-binding domain
MKLTHVVVAGAALVSFSAIAAEEAKKDTQAQSGQTQSQSAQSPSRSGESASGRSASAGATQQQGEKAGGQQMGQNKELVRQAQEKLSEAGHDVGSADGILGPKTQKGLKEFQESKGLQPSGQLDQKTLAELGVSGDASASAGASSDKEASGSASGGASEKASSEKSK